MRETNKATNEDTPTSLVDFEKVTTDKEIVGVYCEFIDVV
jgi:hypothetical protein